MSKLMKVSALLGIGVLLLSLCGNVQAAGSDPNEENTSDSIVIRITPNADYGVTIDTGNVESGGFVDMGALSLYVTTWTVKPATVTIVGTVSSFGGAGGQELDIAASFIGSGTQWSFDASPSTDATSGSVDELSMYVLFSATTDQDVPSGDDFADGTANASIDGSSTRVGGSGGAGARFELQSGPVVDMDNTDVNDQAHMWFLFRLPETTSTGDDQDIQVTLTATGATL